MNEFNKQIDKKIEYYKEKNIEWEQHKKDELSEEFEVYDLIDTIISKNEKFIKELKELKKLAQNTLK